MKKITVKYFRQESDYILLENTLDIMEYFEYTESEFQQYFTKIFKSKVPVNRWDHCLSGGHGESLFSQAVVLGNIKGENPIYLMGSCLQQKIDNFHKCLSNYGNVIVNENGVFCHLVDGMKIISEEPFSFSDCSLLTYTVKIDTQYINLENDPILENYTKNYLGKIDPNFSYILNLRKFSIEDLVNVFNEFHENSGHTVYLYTTGMDVPQMHDYSKALIKSNLNNIIFHFNSGINDDILKVIKYLNDNKVKVEYQTV